MRSGIWVFSKEGNVSVATEMRAPRALVRAAPRQLVDILLAGLEALAAEEQVDAACRLAGQACVAARTVDAHAERRFNALLHRLASRLES